jgi:ferritin-like metal-binding protein YciE
MESLFLDEIRDLYDAERQLVKALPKMGKAAGSDELRQAIDEHLRETEGQVERLAQVFEMLDQKATGKKCVAMTGLIGEADELIKSANQSSVRDAGIIAAAQKVEHYEISGYGSARTFARMLGYEGAASLLDETLNEEKNADSKLNDIAETQINEEAVAEGETAMSRGDSTGTRRNEGPKTRRAGGGHRTT